MDEEKKAALGTLRALEEDRYEAEKQKLQIRLTIMGLGQESNQAIDEFYRLHREHEQIMKRLEYQPPNNIPFR